MDRKEFLLYIGLFLLAITGISAVVKNLTEALTPPPSSSAYGFGSNVYGGITKKGKK